MDKVKILDIINSNRTRILLENDAEMQAGIKSLYSMSFQMPFEKIFNEVIFQVFKQPNEAIAAIERSQDIFTLTSFVGDSKVALDSLVQLALKREIKDKRLFIFDGIECYYHRDISPLKKLCENNLVFFKNSNWETYQDYQYQLYIP